jgi:hypothetical protein
MQNTTGIVNAIVFISVQPGHRNYPPGHGKPCIPVTCENLATTDFGPNVRIGLSQLLDFYQDSEHCLVVGLSRRNQRSTCSQSSA